MEPVKVMATIDGALYEVEAIQVEPERPLFELVHQGKQIARLHKENGRWLSEMEDCLMPDEVEKIGRTIDNRLEHQFG